MESEDNLEVAANGRKLPRIKIEACMGGLKMFAPKNNDLTLFYYKLNRCKKAKKFGSRK